MFQNLRTSIQSEFVKIKYLGFIRILILFSILSALYFQFNSLNDPTIFPSKGFPYSFYLTGLNSMIKDLSYLFLPFFILIIGLRVHQIEHKNNAWRMMETQPLLKSSIFLSKFIWLLALTLAFIIIAVFSSIILMWIYSLFHDLPAIANNHLHFGKILMYILRQFLSSFSFASLVFVMGWIIKNVLVSYTIGIILMLYKAINIFKHNPITAFPLSILYKVDSTKNPSDLGHLLTFDIYLGILEGIIFISLGYIYYYHKNFYYSFIKNSKRGITVALGVIISFFVIKYWFKPKTMSSYPKSVIAGNIDSDTPFKKMVLMDPFEVPLKEYELTDSVFNFELPSNLPLDKYILLFDNSTGLSIILGEKDSIYVDFEYKNLEEKFTVTGTRLAENLVKNSMEFNGFFVEDDKFYNNPKNYIEQFTSSYEDDLEIINQFITNDNYTIRSDFKSMKTKVLNIKYLNSWEQFVAEGKEKYNKNYSDFPLILEMKNSVKELDINLLSNADYVDYLQKQLTLNDNRDISNNEKYREALLNLPNSDFKSRALMLQAESQLKLEIDSTKRQSIIAQYLPFIENKKDKKTLIDLNKQLLTNSQFGKADNFLAQNLSGQEIHLSDFKGKYVLIDVWATWCKPCIKESAYFEKFANDYINAENVVFIALSMDENIQAWKAKAKYKSKDVVQLHITNPSVFNFKYKVESIPTFIMIDPDGNIINSAMPYPSNYKFASLLEENISKDK